VVVQKGSKVKEGTITEFFRRFAIQKNLLKSCKFLPKSPGSKILQSPFHFISFR
jgi:hypothetical protein